MTCYNLDIGCATINVTSEDIRVKVSGNDLSNGYLAEKIVAGTNVTVTELNDGGVETLEIAASGGGGGGVFTPTINSVTMKEVAQESDFGTAVGGVITLDANTTYFVRGIINCSNRLLISNDGTAIKGWNRDEDGLSYTGATGAGDFITVNDVNFELMGLKLSSTNPTGGDVVLRATNFNYGTYNDGRNKVLSVINCQFRNCYDVHYIEGFDLVDLQNNLLWYITSSTIGCQFKNVSKLQISSCEYVRWFEEATLPTPSGYAITPMIELLANAPGNGFGAININGAIVHPQQTQNGIDINTASTTGFGTISSSAFINIGLTTGVVFNPVAFGLPDYSQAATVKFDVFANQGILNSTSGVVMTVSGNTTDTALSTGVPSVINTGTLAVNRAAVRYDVTTGGRATYTGTKQVYVSIHGTISYQKQGGGTDAYIFFIYKNGTLLPGSNFDVTSGGATADGVAAMNYGSLMNQNDYIEIYVENPGSNDDILIKDLQLVIRE